MNSLPPELHTWMASGRFFNIDGLAVYCQQQGTGPDLVCLHGFPTSCWDWQRVLPHLARHFRVTVFDLPGYGLSEKPADRSYSLLRQMDVVAALLVELGISDCHVLSHDMGDTVACEWLFRVAERQQVPAINKLVMLNGGLYMDLHQPLLTQRLLRTPLLGEITAQLSSWRVFMHQFPKVYARPEQFSAAHYRAQWALMLHNDGRKVLAKIACYMRERLRYKQRWLDTLHQSALPVQLIWGQQDPIAVPAIAERLLRLRPQTGLISLPEAAHYPQLEAPETVAMAVTDFLDSA